MALSQAQIQALDNISPRAIRAGVSLGTMLDDIYDQLTAGQFSIKAEAPDIDSIALGGGAASLDSETTTGLTLGYKAGRVMVLGAVSIAIAAGTIALSASTTNYVEVSTGGVVAAGTVTKNTLGFTAGRVPLYTVVTGVAAITTITQSKHLLTALPASGLPGSALSTAAKTQRLHVSLGTISATTSILIHAPSFDCKLGKLALLVDTTVATNASDYWTFALTNKGAGSAAVVMLEPTDANTTKTSGSAITAYTQRNLATYNSTPANLVTAANNCLLFTATKTGSAANLSNAALSIEFPFDV